ncbi:MAG: invasion associated locus B family protein [Planktomarina sp.]
MMKSFILTAALALGVLSSAAQAQDSTNRVAAETDWSVFVETNPTECWAVTAPKETVNTRDGRVVAVRRSDILFFVFYRPSANVKGQVAFTGGYPFAAGRSITLTVDGNSYEMSTKGEWAWPPTPGDDAKIVAAMKRGARAVITAQSGRGTQTKDTFSLLGFTAALEDAEKRCAG